MMATQQEVVVISMNVELFYRKIVQTILSQSDANAQNRFKAAFT